MRYKFSIPDLEDTTYELHFMGHDGFGEVKLEAVRAGTTDLVVHLVRAARLIGHLVVPPGGSMPRSVGYMVHHGTSGHGSSLEVDANGRFVLDDVAADADGVSIEADGYPAQMLDHPRLRPGEDLEVTIALEQGGIVSGRVLDEAGKPIAGASVSVHRAGAEGPAPGASAQTDDAGAFRVTGAPSGAASVSVYRQGYGYAFGEAASVQVPAGGEASGVVIRLKKRTKPELEGE